MANGEKAGLKPRLNSLAISRDGSLVAVGGSGQTNKGVTDHRNETTFFDIRVLDEKTGELMWSHFGRRGYMMQLAFSPDGKALASATYGEVRIWDARAGDLRQTLKPRFGDDLGLGILARQQVPGRVRERERRRGVRMFVDDMGHANWRDRPFDQCVPGVWCRGLRDDCVLARQ